MLITMRGIIGCSTRDLMEFCTCQSKCFFFQDNIWFEIMRKPEVTHRCKSLPECFTMCPCRLEIFIITQRSLPTFDVSPLVTIYTASTCCCYCVELRCTQAYKHRLSSQRCHPYRQEPKVPLMEMSLFPLGCHTMSARLSGVC